MTPASAALAELFLSVAAVVGLWTLHASLRAQSPDDPITRRFVFGLRVTMLLFAGRALSILFGAGWIMALVFVAAALVPLAVLLLTEGLLRRHAPPSLKAVAAGGAVVFGLMAFLPDAWVGGVRLWGLLVLQMAVLAGAGAMVWLRDRASLNASENETAARLALSLVLLIPLIGADYMMDMIGLPVRLSALGVLVLCWLAIGLNRPGGSGPVIRNLATMAAIAVVSGIVMAAMTGGGVEGLLIFGVCTLAAILVQAVLTDARAGRAEGQSLTLLRHMAEAPTTDPLTFLRGLQRLAAVEGAVLLEAGSLRDLDAGVLERIFRARPVLRRTDPAPADPEEADHVAHLFSRYAASHIITLGTRPPQLVALAMPSLAASPQAELELQVVQRMASLMLTERTA